MASKYTTKLQDAITVVKGNIGIGTDIPSSQLHVAGSITVDKNFVLKDRPLGLGIESLLIPKNGIVTLDPNLPTSVCTLTNTISENPPNYWNILATGNGTEYNFKTGVDGDGNVITAFATTSSTLTITSPNLMTHEVQYTGRGTLVSSFNPRGQLNWRRKIQGAQNGFVLCRGVISDMENNVIIAGRADFALSVYDQNETPKYTYQNIGSGAMFACKYNQSGSPLWSFRTANNGNVFGAATDGHTDDIYLVGILYDGNANMTLLYPNGTSSNIDIPQISGNAGFLLKVDKDGNPVWCNIIDSPGGSIDDYAFDVDIDPNLNVLVCTQCDTSPTIYSQDGSNVVLPLETRDAIVKYDASGNVTWVVGVQSSLDYSGIYGVKTDGNANVYAGGMFRTPTIQVRNSDGSSNVVSTPLTQNSGYNQSYLLKLSPEGIFQWAATIVSSYTENLPASRETAARDIEVDDNGNVYVAIMQYNGGITRITSADGTETTLATSLSINNAARILKFNSSGVFQKEIGYVNATNPHIRGLAYDPINDYIYAAGFGESAITVRNTSNEVMFTVPGPRNAFVAAYDVNGEGVHGFPRIVVPRQQGTSFKKDILLSTSNVVPTYLHLQRLDGSYKVLDFTPELSNVANLKSFVWTSNSWVSSDELYSSRQGVNNTSFFYGDQAFTSSGVGYMGTRIQWDYPTMDNKLAFRASARCSLASDDEIAYHQFQALVSPVADSGTERPNGITYADVGDVFRTSFSNFTQTVERVSDTSVDLKVHWNTSSSNYIGNLEIHVLSSMRLGDIAFTPIHI